MKKFIRPYIAYFLGFLLYKSSLYTLNKLFNMVDEIIEIDTDTSNDTNALPDGTNDIITTHDYDTCKEVVKIVNVRGGQNDLVLRGPVGLIRKQFSSIIKFNGKVISIILRPFAKAVGYLLLKIPALRNIYDVVKKVKVVLASVLAFYSLRLVARFDYWALIFSDAIPYITTDQKSVLASIRHMRMGVKYLSVCILQSNKILNLVMDEEIDLEEKNKKLINILSFYEFLPENHVFKNRYFVCIVHMLLALFIGDKKGFQSVLKLLLRLLKNGQISLQTYQEIISQLIIGGVSPIELEVI